MSGKITIVSKPPKLERKKRVAAYARVSSGKDAMLHSLSAQVSYYSDLIQNHGDWLYTGVYSDEAKTGTKDSRAGFQNLVADCRDGKIDMVITKSISRFARNTVTLLQTVREFKALGVDIYFEEQNIHTISGDGELMMTILASYAQEESRSASENQKWRIKRSFESGIPWDRTLMGYRMENEHYVIVPREAEIVRRIYNEYLSGSGYQLIAKRLNEEGVPSRFGGKWNQSAVSRILSNHTYTGNLCCKRHSVKTISLNGKSSITANFRSILLKKATKPLLTKKLFKLFKRKSQGGRLGLTRSLCQRKHIPFQALWCAITAAKTIAERSQKRERSGCAEHTIHLVKQLVRLSRYRSLPYSKSLLMSWVRMILRTSGFATEFSIFVSAMIML